VLDLNAEKTGFPSSRPQGPRNVPVIMLTATAAIDRVVGLGSAPRLHRQPCELRIGGADPLSAAALAGKATAAPEAAAPIGGTGGAVRQMARSRGAGAADDEGNGIRPALRTGLLKGRGKRVCVARRRSGAVRATPRRSTARWTSHHADPAQDRDRPDQTAVIRTVGAAATYIADRRRRG
jgi:hypothetical protein